MNYRTLIGHDTVRVLFDCPQCGGVAAVRDHVTAAVSGRSWIDCAGCGLGRYGAVDQAYCRAVVAVHGSVRPPRSDSPQPEAARPATPKED